MDKPILLILSRQFANIQAGKTLQKFDFQTDELNLRWFLY